MRMRNLRTNLNEILYAWSSKMADYERVLLSKPEVFVYQIPPRTTARGYKASDWNLAAPTWTVRMRMVTKGDGKLIVRLEDKISGQMFAQCPLDGFPSTAVESVSDSSRYFVIRVVNDQTGKQAFLGLGFGDRADSFDFNVALQDFFKEKQTEELIQKEAQRDDQKPKLDLGFKEGQTITISIAGKGGETGARSRPRVTGSAAGAAPLLPPPPSAGSSRRGRSPATISKSMQPQQQQQQQQSPETEHAGGGSMDSGSYTNSDAVLSMPKPPLPQQTPQQQQPSTNQDIMSLFG